MSQFYGGSTILAPLVNIIGIPVDQINFIACSLLSIGLGQLMRYKFPPHKFSGSTRGIIEALFGFIIAVFCFGYQLKYLLLQSMVSYVILMLFPSRIAAHIVTYWCMGFMAVVHLYRMHYDYGGYTLDISGPVMIQTQKLTSLAFNLLDGHRINQGIKLHQKNHESHAVKKLPDVLKFFGYTFYFHGILAGPFVFYNDYKEYIVGYDKKWIPCAKKQLSAALLLSVIHGLLTAYVAPQFPYIFVCSTDYQRMHMSRRVMFTMISFFLVRQKYYFAWSVVEAGALSTGLGYSGKHENGENNWSKVKNYDFMAIEAGSSLKLLVDGWNISTTRWLRELIYERAPLFCRTILVFLTSAFWHGFYPGYYMMFLTFSLFTFCARTVRKHIRPSFATSPITLQLYHVLTTIFTNLALNYGQGPFYLLEFQAALLFWKPYYFVGHILAMFFVLTLQFRPIINDKVKEMNFITKNAQDRFQKLKHHLQRKLG